jgi:hypothetical protein
VKHRFVGRAIPVFVVLFLSLVAEAFQGPTVIFSNIATSPTSDVPGFPGHKFNPGTATQFDRPFMSPDGSRWVFGAVADDPTTDLDVLIIGSGTTGAGAFMGVKEGDTVPGIAPTAVYSTINTQMGINNSGHYAFSGDTTAASTSDDVAVRWTAGGGFELMAREGQQAPGQGAGIGYGSSNNACNISSDDSVWFRSAALTGATTQQVLYKNQSLAVGSVIAQTDNTIPGGQLVAPSQSIDNFTSDRFRVDAMGLHSIYHADLNGPTATDLVMVYDGNVVAQEGVVLPGSGFASLVSSLSGDAGSQQISHNGTHYAFRGSNVDGIDWVKGASAMLAVTDQPIYTGATELFDDTPFSTTFFINAVNGMGDYVIGGTTNNPNASMNAVLVLNGTTEVLREGDPVDVNGNGLFDDDAFLSVFNNDDSFLTDDLKYYFNADLRNGAGTSIGQAFLVAQVPEPSSLALFALAAGLLLRRRVR